MVLIPADILLQLQLTLVWPSLEKGRGRGKGEGVMTINGEALVLNSNPAETDLESRAAIFKMLSNNVGL